MSLILKRLFAFFTLVCYLVVGTVVVRFYFPEKVNVAFNQSYLEFLKDAPIKVALTLNNLKGPEMKFAKVIIPADIHFKKKTVRKTVARKQNDVLAVVIVHSKYELPFHEIIKIDQIKEFKDLPTNLTALYKEFTFEEKMIARVDVVEDTINTKQAATQSDKLTSQAPILIKEVKKAPLITHDQTETLPVLKSEKAPKISQEVAKNKNGLVPSEKAENPESLTVTTQQEIKATEISEENVENIETEEISDLVAVKENEKEAIDEPTYLEKTTNPQDDIRALKEKNQEEHVDLVAFDYSKSKQDTATKKIPSVGGVSKQNISLSQDEHQDLVAFDYSKAKQDIATKKMTSVATVSNQKKSLPVKMPMKVNTLEASEKAITKKLKTESYPMDLSIRALGSDLQRLNNLEGFEVRFQDDLSETLEDFGSGEVKFESVLSEPKMTRSVVILKRGYVPTSTELILEEGYGSVSVPLIEEDVLNELARPYEGNGSVGSLLVELDDETEIAKLDVPFSEVLKLNGDLNKTDGEDFRYQLFLGVKSGNSMISYHRQNGEVVSKILHIHENELTYDANFYEDIINEKVRLFEEDLLGRENTPLIISGEQVRVFAKNSYAKKINNHTYKMNFHSSHLGGRRYLELTHQSEPVFVGLRENTSVVIPSENFMRFILSKVEGEKLGNRCLVQLNLKKKAQKYDVSSESVGASLMTSSQILDTDGKFYDSLSDKSRKIIVVGESQASSDISPEAKINVKIQYLDGTIQFINTYCSPNTYLVEQL